SHQPVSAGDVDAAGSLGTRQRGTAAAIRLADWMAAVPDAVRLADGHQHHRVPAGAELQLRSGRTSLRHERHRTERWLGARGPRSRGTVLAATGGARGARCDAGGEI